MSDKEPNPTVLIVDDTPTNLGVVVEFLEENGFRVVVAQDGKEGLQRAAFIKPDLILLDVMMPGMDGFEVCRQLKATIATRDTPVIFMTALADTASKLEGFKVGGVDYITKPLAIEEMLARVTTHVALRSTQQKLDQQNQRLQREASVRQIAESTLQEAHDELKNVYKRLENAKIQLLHATKLASVGMLARGAAQQIGLPISSLKDHLLHMEECISRQHDLIAALEAFEEREGKAPQLSDAIKRHEKDGADLLQIEQGTRQLISELKGDLGKFEDFKRALNDLAAFEPDWHVTTVAQVLEDTLGMLTNELGEKTNISRAYEDIPQIECRPAELMQVFMNLLLNAAQAISENGEIQVATGVQGQEVWIDICDNGVGIPAENLTRIFDPFYTNKPNGKGAGLGLSLALAAIRKHHGRIDVSSTPDVGSTFRVWLPVRQPVMAAEAA
jgi:two-component system NtrC family sensor kinase